MRTNGTLLYYPTVSVPSEWAKTALFNGYSIGSVTPKHWHEIPIGEQRFDPSQNGYCAHDTPELYLKPPEIEILSDNKLFKKIDPANNIYINRTFKKDFYNIIESNAFNDESKNFHKISDIPREMIHKQSWIHKDKISQEIVDYLVRKDLADPKVKKEGGMEYYIVQDNVANLYISLLSQDIASKIPKTIPSSDSIKHWNNLSNPDYSPNKERCIDIAINNSILSPVPGTPIEKIIEFRDEYRYECDKYQKKLNDTIQIIACTSDIDEIPEIMEEQLNDIQAELKDLKENTKFKCNLQTLRAPIILLADMGEIACDLLISKTINPEIITSTIPCVLASIDMYQNWIKRPKEILINSPYTYLYLAKKEGLSNI